MADKLKNLRAGKEVSVDFLEKKLNIPAKYLIALEEGSYEILPGDIYVRAWLKKIATFYEVDHNGLLVDYQLEKKIEHKVNNGDKEQKKRNIKNGSLLRPRILRWMIVGTVVLTLFVYLAFEIVNIIAPPYLNILEPSDNFKTKEVSIEITGQTIKEAQVFINEELIVLDQEGNFKKTVNLTVGLNNLRISAKKKHSRTRHVELLILRESLE